METSGKARDTMTDSTGETAPTFLVNNRGLKTLRARSPLKKYVADLWKTRHFISHDARAKAMSAGRGTILGFAWIILNPAIQVGLYAFVFGFVLKINRGIDNFIGFLIIGVIYFGFMSSGLNAGANLIQRNRGLLNSFSFPKASVAISTGIRAAIDNFPAAILAVVCALLSQFRDVPSWTVLFVLPIYLLLHLFITGLVLIIARITAFIPDFKSLLTVVTRILFFTSGVFWPIERFIHDPTLAQIMSLNPFHQYLLAVRTVVLDGQVPQLFTILSILLWPLTTFAFGLVFFWKAEHRYATIK